MLRKFATA